MGKFVKLVRVSTWNIKSITSALKGRLQSVVRTHIRRIQDEIRRSMRAPSTAGFTNTRVG